MKNINTLFKQTTHPKHIDDFYHIFNSNNLLNAIYWWEFFREINFNEVEGDIVECGVGRGRSLITLCAINRLVAQYYDSKQRKIFALDSFEGFPEPHKFDLSKRNPKKGEWSMSPNRQFEYSITSIEKVLKLAEVDVDVNFVKGFFDKTTLNLHVNKIAILHLDGDLYESIKFPLDNLWNKVSLGGIIVFDDFSYDEKTTKDEPFPGARKAVMDFLKTNNNFDYLKSLRGTPYLKRVK